MMLGTATDAETIGPSEVRNTVVFSRSELEVGTYLESDRQPMRHRNAGKDRAFDNYMAQLSV